MRRQVAYFCAAQWPIFAPPLTLLADVIAANRKLLEEIRFAQRAAGDHPGEAVVSANDGMSRSV